MQYPLTESPLVDDTKAGIRISTFTAQFMGINKPGIKFASIVCLPCPTLDSIETKEYPTESYAIVGHEQLKNKYSSWSQNTVQAEIRNRVFQ